MPYKLLDPNEDADYVCDWNLYLDDAGSPSDTIASSSWIVLPQSESPQRPDLHGTFNSGGITAIFINEGIEGQTYRLTNRIVTAQGRTADRSFTLLCRSR